MKFTGVLGVVSGYTEKIQNGKKTGIMIPDIKEFNVRGDTIDYRYSVSPQSFEYDKKFSITNQYSFIVNKSLLDALESVNADTAVYLKIKEVKWTVNSVQIKYPRIIVTLGSVYNG